jgi:hypothetical protein
VREFGLRRPVSGDEYRWHLSRLGYNMTIDVDMRHLPPETDSLPGNL